MPYNTLQQTIDALFLPSYNRAIIEKIAILPNREPRGIFARYCLSVATKNKNGNQALIKTYHATKLGAIEKTNDYDFIVFVPCGYKLPSLIDCVKLTDLFKNNKNIFTPCLSDANGAINNANGAAWISELKSAIKNGKIDAAINIIKTTTRAEFITKDGILIGVDWRFMNDYNTVNKLLSAIGINPREFSAIIDALISQLHQSFIAGYAVNRIDDADEITRIYKNKSVCFESCMTGKNTPARIYGADYLEGRKSVALHAIYYNNQYIGRFLVRLKNNKYPSLYTSSSNEFIKHVLDSLGFECNPSALIGARLPLITDNYNAVFMPYIDGTDKDIKFIDNDGNPYLQIGGKNGDTIGIGNSTRGYLNVNSYGYQLGFKDSHNVDFCEGYDDDDDDDNHDNEFYCNACNEWHDNEFYNNIDGDAICDDCRAEHYYCCDDCNDMIAIDDCYNLEVYDFKNSNTQTITVCESCECDYWREPINDEIYYRISDIRKHVLGLR